MAADIADGNVVEIEAGSTLTVTITGAPVMVDDATTDIDAGGGVVHVIDGTLIP